MVRLLKGLIFVFLFLILAVPTHAAGACVAPRPESPALDLLIKEAQKRGGAAANVPTSVLKAIYLIEGSVPYSNPDQYACKANSAGALGLMQIKEGEYKSMTPDNEEMADSGVCQATDCKLSRCNPSDAMELASRLLLFKVGLWDTSANKPTGKITTKEQVYNASCNYYGSYNFDSLTSQLSAYVGKNPHDGQLSYCEFVGVQSGFYSTSNLPWPRGSQSLPKAQTPAKFTFNACEKTSSTINTNFDVHPLRPFPKKPIAGQTGDLTPYCVMRPIAVEQNKLDKRELLVDLKTQGTLTQDFSKFITPLLSITDPKKSDYSLPYSDKAQRYLADFLEGRAYYEPQAEPANPTPAENIDIFNRLGVFRKLASAEYQNELKKAMIFRAARIFGAAGNPYGFEPSSAVVNDYTVGSWSGEKVTLYDYFVNKAWAPLSKDFGSKQQQEFATAYEAWKVQDGGKWYDLWPYVPMFTREDSKGRIDIVDSNPPPDPLFPGTSYEERNQSSTTSIDVTFPHLARTYEVSTSLSYLLTPKETHETATAPELTAEWMPRLWESNNMWLDPSYFRPKTNEIGVEVGPICDIDFNKISAISTSGDPAYDSIFTTSVNRVDYGVPNPAYDPDAAADVTDACGTHDACEVCRFKRINPITLLPAYELNDSKCYVYKNVSSSPDYLISYTPYLEEILTSLMSSDRAVFDLFKPAGAEEQPYEKYDWPGVGNSGEESPVYSYTANSEEHSRAEAGGRKPGDSQGYFYRYLGSIQCAKEKVLQVLQPFITGERYQAYASQCFGLGDPGHALTGLTTTGGIGAACTDTKGSMGTISVNNTSNIIAMRAWQIVYDLYQGFWCYWNRSPGDFDTDVVTYYPSYPELFDEAKYASDPNADPLSGLNLFWCTWLVTKAYNETGHSMPTDLLFTPSMASWFQSKGKYLIATEKNPDFDISQVHPGDAVFFRIPFDYWRLNHVAIVYNVSVDGITTVESNAGYKTMFYPYSNGRFQRVGTIQIEGFGQQ